MRPISVLSLGLAAVTLAGCVFLPRPKQPSLREKYPPPLFEDYVGHIKAWSSDGALYKIPVPTIAPSREITAPVKLSTPFARIDDLHLASLDATKICFGFVSRGDRSTVPADDVAKKQLEDLQGLDISIRALSSLASERGKRLWPVSADAKRVDSFTVISDEVQDFDNTARGTVERRRVVKFNVCAPAPEITSATKFIVITAHFADSMSEPIFESYDESFTKDFREEKERDNQRERLKQDGMILISITEGAPDLTM